MILSKDWTCKNCGFQWCYASPSPKPSDSVYCQCKERGEGDNKPDWQPGLCLVPKATAK